jgi:DNA-binding transcriptional ArsR family regulator
VDDSAELFEAIAHPTRIKILKILEQEPSTFASLKRQLNLDSSGNLDHHLKKLGPLITVQSNGLYALSDAGKKALASVGVVEEWKESERFKLRALPKKPFGVSFLAVLTFAATAVTALVTGHVIFSDALNVPYLPMVYLIAAALGCLSFVGLLMGKGWGWTLTVVQAALVLIYVLVPFYFDLYAPNILAITSTEKPSPMVWIASGFLAAIELGTLLIAMKQPVKEYLGKQNATPLRYRALAAGTLGILSGVLELYTGSIYFFAPASEAVGGGAPIFTLYYFSAGIPLALGGVAILLRKYLLGGVLTLVFSLFPFPYFYVGTVFPSLVGLNAIFPVYFVVAALLVVMPYAAVALAFLSRPKF